MSHILLIEDEDFFRGMLRATLETIGHTVTEARDGKEGLACHARAVADLVVIDLVLTDIIMPEKEGIETIIELRKKNPDVKIIAMSGGGRVSAAQYLKAARQVGARRVLQKPFSGDELAMVIQDVLADGTSAKPS